MALAELKFLGPASLPIKPCTDRIEGQPDEAPPQSLCATWRDDLAARYVVWVDARQEHIGPFFGDTVSTLPLHLVVTQDGIIRARRTGAIPADIRSIIEEWLSQ